MFAEQISAWREVRGLTQEELSRRAGIPRPNLSDIERGRQDITVSTLARIASALSLSPGRLLDESPQLAAIKDRHEADALAKAIVSGDRPFSDEKNRLADSIASQVTGLLKAHGAKGFTNVRRLTRDAGYRRLKNTALYGPETVNRILARLPKHLS